jgi:hypothetical protein
MEVISLIKLILVNDENNQGYGVGKGFSAILN